MAKNQLALPQGENYQAINELVEVTLRTRKDNARAKELRKKAKKEAIRLYHDRGWKVGTDNPYNGVTLRLYEEKVYTWAKNHKIEDQLMELYRTQLEHNEWLKQQLKQSEANLKKTSLDLAKAHPDSESIKSVLKFQIR